MDSSRSSVLVRVTRAAPGAASRAGMSRSRVLPDPCGPMTPAVRSHGTHSCPPRGSCAAPSTPPDVGGLEASHRCRRLPYRSGRTTGATRRSRDGSEHGLGLGAGGHPANPPGTPRPPRQPGRPGEQDDGEDLGRRPGTVYSSAAWGGRCGGEPGAGVAAEQGGQAGEQLRLRRQGPAGAGQAVGGGAGQVRGEDQDEPGDHGRGQRDLPGARVGGGASVLLHGVLPCRCRCLLMPVGVGLAATFGDLSWCRPWCRRCRRRRRGRSAGRR